MYALKIIGYLIGCVGLGVYLNEKYQQIGTVMIAGSVLVLLYVIATAVQHSK